MPVPAPEDRLRRAQARVTRHSRIVRWMKIALPVGALLVIGAIFLVGRERAAVFDPGTAARIAAMGTGMRLDNPRFSGLTEAGDPFVITADSALPDGAMPNRIELEMPEGRLQMGEQTVTVTSDTGEIFREEERLNLVGDVVLVTSDGYRAETASVAVDLAARTAEAPTRFRAVGPRGSIEADRAHVVGGQSDDDDGDADEGATIYFEGNVQVNWRPAVEEADAGTKTGTTDAERADAERADAGDGQGGQ